MSRGRIEKRDDSWGFRASYTDDTGRRRWVKQYNRRWTKTDAQKALTAKLAAIDAGHTLGTAKGTVADYLQAWFDRYQASGNVKRTTAATTRLHLDAYLLPRIGKLQLRELKPAKVAALYADLLANGRTGNGHADNRSLAPKTVRNIAGTLHKALSDAVRLNILPTNPADNVDLPRWEKPEIETWSLDQTAQFLGHLHDVNEVSHALWRLVLLCGLRRGEALGLRWSDVDLVDGTIAIRQTRVVAGNTVVVDTPKTKAGRRTVAIDAGTVDALAKLKDAHEAAKEALGGWSSDLVGTALDGRPVHPLTMSRHFKAAATAAGLPVIRLHDGRHTAISEMLRQGVPIHVVSKRAGHSRVSTTLDTYAHALPQADRVAADSFGAALADAMLRRESARK
jgi:integrase